MSLKGSLAASPNCARSSRRAFPLLESTYKCPCLERGKTVISTSPPSKTLLFKGNSEETASSTGCLWKAECTQMYQCTEPAHACCLLTAPTFLYVEPQFYVYTKEYVPEKAVPASKGTPLPVMLKGLLMVDVGKYALSTALQVGDL